MSAPYAVIEYRDDVPADGHDHPAHVYGPYDQDEAVNLAAKLQDADRAATVHPMEGFNARSV